MVLIFQDLACSFLPTVLFFYHISTWYPFSSKGKGMPSLSVFTASVGVTQAWLHPQCQPSRQGVAQHGTLCSQAACFDTCLSVPPKLPAFYLQISLGSGSSHRSSAALHMLPSSRKHPSTQTEILSVCPFIVLLEWFFFSFLFTSKTSQWLAKNYIKYQGGVEFSAVSQSLCELFFMLLMLRS